MWSCYDLNGNGYITYQDFWVLTAKFAMIIGVDQKSMLEDQTRKNFLEVLGIPIYEENFTGIFCLKFHDVIVNLTLLSVTLKYGVTK